MGSLWTQERNRLELGMVKAELLIRHNIMLSCSEFHNAVKDHEQLLKAARSVSKYDFKKK